MSVELIFLRHLPHEVQGRVMVGRSPGVRLAAGAEARLDALSRRLERERIDRVVSGPLERVQATARGVAERLGLPVETDPDLDEIDFGGWTGKAMADLDGDPDWTIWNTVRARAGAPGGETLAQAQARMARATERLLRERSGEHVLVVSHGDPIKLALAWRLGLGIDRIDHFDIDPGSLSHLVADEGGARLKVLNETPLP